MICFFDKRYSFLSNFYPAPITNDGIVYPTNEHFFQAMKTTNTEERKKIAAAETPREAKEMGRSVALRSDWEEIKTDVMMTGLRKKFAYPELKDQLLATGDEWLEEGNTWHDNAWGNCWCDKCIRIPGRNMLGMLLMYLRDELKES